MTTVIKNDGDDECACTGSQYQQQLPAGTSSEGLKQLQNALGLVCQAGQQLLQGSSSQIRPQMATSLMLAASRIVQAVPSGKAVMQ